MPKHDVEGLEHGQIDEASGTLYRSRRPLPLIKHEVNYGKDKPPGILLLVNLGNAYAGPVPPLGGTHLYAVDELACYTFWGKPEAGWRWSYVHHIDGDSNGKDNIIWASFEKLKNFAAHRALMRPDHLPRRILPARQLLIDSNNKELPIFAGSASVPPIPTISHKFGAA